MTLVGLPYSLDVTSVGTDCQSCWQIINLEYAFGLPTETNGSFNYKAGLFEWFRGNPNATVWDFNIRTNASWSDGVPITSSDVAFTFQLGGNLILGTLRDFLNLSSFITNVEPVNSSDTRFTLNRPLADFGNFLTNQYYYPVLPEHFWTNLNSSTLNFGQDVTSGPFFHLNYSRGSKMVLVANPHYWNPVGISQIEITFVNSLNESLPQLLSNSTDLSQVSPQQAAQLAESKSISLNSEPDRRIQYLAYNISEPPFNNVAFRQALAASINTENISKNIFEGYATPGALARGTIPPSATLWHNQSTIQYNYNLTQAKDILTSQGFKTSSTGNLLYPNGTAVIFKVYYDENESADALTANEVSSDLQALGIHTSLNPLSFASMEHQYDNNVGDISRELVVASSDLPVFGFGQLDIQPGWDNYFPWLRPQAAWLEPASAQSDYVQFGDVINSSTDASQVERAIRSIDYLNSEFLPLIVLSYPDSVWATRTGSGLTGLPVGNSSSLDFGALTLDPYIFSQIACLEASECSSGLSVSTQSTFTSSSSANTSSSATASSAPPSTTSYEIITIVAVIAIIVMGTAFSRRRKPAMPEAAPSSGTS